MQTTGLDAKRILSYTAKKRAFVATVAVVLCIVALCLVDVNSSITLISLPIIIAAAFVLDKVFIFIRPDVYGKDMIKRGRTPIIATTTVVAAFTAICLLSGIVGYQLAMYTAKNANVVGTYDNIEDAIDFLSDSGLSDKYEITVNMTVSGKTEFRVTADFVPESGEYDESDFANYRDVEVEGNVVTVTIKAYSIEYKGEKIAYYVLNKEHLNAKIEVTETGVNVVDYGNAFGAVIGAAFGAAAQIAILAMVYIVGIIAAIVPSEIYFEKLIRNEAKAVRARSQDGGANTDDKAEEENPAQVDGEAQEESTAQADDKAQDDKAQE